LSSFLFSFKKEAQDRKRSAVLTVEKRKSITQI